MSEIEPSGGVDKVLQLPYIPLALLIEFDGYRGNPARLLRALFDSEFIANTIKDEAAFTQVVGMKSLIVATEVLARHHNILHAVAIAKGPL